MYIPHIKPIDGIDELLKVVSKSELWTERIGQIKEYTEWINGHLDIAGTKEDAKKAESEARGLVREAEETKSQVDEYAARTRNEADSYVQKRQLEAQESLAGATRRMDAAQRREQDTESLFKANVAEQDRLAKIEFETAKLRKQATDKLAEAKALQEEYLSKLAQMKELAG